MSERKSHWEKVYQTKEADEVSWTQAVPQTSLDFINSFELPKISKIIDIGGGDSKLVDNLLAQGFSDITDLDISEAALKKAKKRLGKKSVLVKWIVSDITKFQATEHYDVWHIRKNTNAVKNRMIATKTAHRSMYMRNLHWIHA